MVVDCIREVKPPLSPENVIAEFVSVLKSYHCHKVTGDRYGGEFPREQFRKRGITYKPGAIAPGSPTVDLSKTGDTLFTNAFVDNLLGTQDGFIRATALLYANGRDLKDPLLSPIYGDVHGFPPAILTSGTRDLYLSNTVRMHRKLRAAGKGNLTCST